MGKGRLAPDVRATACMRDCAIEPTVASFVPDHARNAHGNLAQQNRPVGQQVGADTSQPARPVAAVAAPSTVAVPPVRTHAQRLCPRQQHRAGAVQQTQLQRLPRCRQTDLGPGMRDVAPQKTDGQRADSADHLAGRILSGCAGVWSAIPMPAQYLSPDDARALAR